MYYGDASAILNFVAFWNKNVVILKMDIYFVVFNISYQINKYF